jgi:dihydroorotate dehydrogenase
VQVYSGLIYEGPGLVRNILVDLAKQHTIPQPH